MDPRYNPQQSTPDAYNAYIYGDWNYQQAHHQESSSQQNIYPPSAPHVYSQNSRQFPQQQQYAQQRPHFPVYQQQQQQQHNRSYRPDLVHNHQSNYSNHQQQQQQHYLIMNQQQQQPHQMGNYNNHHIGNERGGSSGGGGEMMNSRSGGIQNRLNFNSPQLEPVQIDPVPHKQTETEQLALDFLSEVVSKLNDNPGLFENYQKKLRELFQELADNHFVMSNAIETIFEHSINEQNFRYTGARLCLLLDSLDLSSTSTFRNLLVMKMDFQNTEQIPYMQNDQRRVRGSTLFLAELFVQLSRPEDTRSAVDVSHYVLNSIMLLLTKPGPENIKCVCQTLKLSGYDLQKESPTEVEEAINQLKIIAEEQNIQTKRLIQSVVDLFYDNWGRKDAVEIENQPPALQQQPPAHLNNPQQYNDTVFYGPDGQILTEEESTFLNANMPESYPINIDDIIDDESDDFVDEEDEPEMDLEMQMAYKEFINSGKEGKKKE
ncbi:hypothetical protein PVAND_005898 [Polypedilum vanderplanki]|uniref:MIF4G domain-containing protein n=1 Tax=Polypedilum vanderplanki TaxID=319348 RepID=A0A9J6C2K7_POLVA|nr:hypothetical protein PVAND_005898 [Polypedilum vanderplanki]